MTPTRPTTQWFHLKVREKGKRAFWFLSGKGGLNRLRIHAAIFSDRSRAEVVLAEILRDNPNLEAKIV